MNKRMLMFGAFGFAIVNFSVTLQAQDPLETWNKIVVPGLYSDLKGIAYGNGVFVAVGNGSAIGHSADGVNWTFDQSGGYGDFQRVRFINGLFLAVGASNQLLSSSNGLQWTSSLLPTNSFWEIAGGNGMYVFAGSGTYASSNLIDFVKTHPILVGAQGRTYETLLDTVVYANGVFVAMPTMAGVFDIQNPPRPTLRSTNGLDWIAGGGGPRTLVAGLGNMTADGSLVVAYYNEGSGGPNGKGIVTSTNNGVDWCCYYQTQNTPSGGLALGQGQHVFVGVDLFPKVITSQNGKDWTWRTQLSENRTVRAAAFGGGVFVAVGLDSYILVSGNIGGLPQIVAQPEDRGAVVGNPAGFSVQVSGAPPLSFQWYCTNAVPGATNSTLTITNTSTSDVGGYFVVITNSFGSVTSRVAQLTVSFLNIKSYAGITILGISGKTYRIDATPAEGVLNWQTLTNIVLPTSPYIWFDRDSPNVGNRLYRAAELP